jgi:WD40 repeat protein
MTADNYPLQILLLAFSGWVYALAFIPSGDVLASGGGNAAGTGVGVRIWDAR